MYTAAGWMALAPGSWRDIEYAAPDAMGGSELYTLKTYD